MNETTTKPTVPTVASRVKYIYYFVAVSVVNTIISLFISIPQVKSNIAAQQKAAMTQLTTGQIQTITFIGVGIGIALAAALYIYLLRARNVKTVRVWLIVLFVLALLGLLVQLTDFDLVPFLLSAAGAVLLGLSVRETGRLVRQA